jgi:hypothetical protein
MGVPQKISRGSGVPLGGSPGVSLGVSPGVSPPVPPAPPRVCPKKSHKLPPRVCPESIQIRPKIDAEFARIDAESAQNQSRIDLEPLGNLGGYPPGDPPRRSPWGPPRATPRGPLPLEGPERTLSAL